MKKTKKFDGLRILLLDGQVRQAAIIMEELYKLGCIITTVNESKLDIGYSSRYPKNKIVDSKIKGNSLELKRLLDEEIPSGKYDVVFPLIEPSCIIVGDNYSFYSRFVKITATDYDSFNLAYDKQKTMEICMQNNIPCPLTRKENQNFEDFAKTTGFPLAFKPRNGVGSIGFYKIDTMEDFYNLKNLKHIDIEKYVIQEFVKNSKVQYNTYIFIDNNGEVKSSLVAEATRTYPLDIGTPGYFRTVKRPDILEIAIRLLKLMNTKGYASVCFIESQDDKIPKVMEINARISGSIKIAHMTGVNVAKQHLQRALNNDVDMYESNIKENLRLKHFHTDILWFIKSKDRFSTFLKFRFKDMVFSIYDPIPFFTYGIQGLLRYKSVMSKKKRS